MSVYKVPGWMCEPCHAGEVGYEDHCAEPGVHGGHLKWYWRLLFRSGLLR